jgi:hypothetical protein
MRTDPRKIRELLEEYASLIPLAGNVPAQDEALMRDLEAELLSWDVFSISTWTCSSRNFQRWR